MGFFKGLLKGLGSMIGIEDTTEQRRANKAMEAERERLANIQKQNLILDNANEQNEILTFEDTSLGITDDTSSNTRRKKQATGSATSSLGINL